MAQLKGKGSMTGVNLIVSTFDNNVTKDGKTRFLDAQIDHRDPRAAGQTNLHLISNKVEGADGKARYNNGAAYTAQGKDGGKSQFEQLVETAGPNVEPILKDGKPVGQRFAVKANLMPSSKGNGLVVNIKSLEQSDFKLDGKTMDGQIASVKAAVETRNATKAAQAEAKAAAPEQSAEEQNDVQVQEADAPSVG